MFEKGQRVEILLEIIPNTLQKERVVDRFPNKIGWVYRAEDGGSVVLLNKKNGDDVWAFWEGDLKPVNDTYKSIWDEI